MTLSWLDAVKTVCLAVFAKGNKIITIHKEFRSTKPHSNAMICLYPGVKKFMVCRNRKRIR